MVVVASAAIGIGVTRLRSAPSSGPGRLPVRPVPPPLPSARGSASWNPPRYGGRISATMDSTTDYRPTLDSWMTLFKIYGPDVPVPVVRAWLTEESGGNPCAIGGLPPAGATQPQE